MSNCNLFKALDQFREEGIGDVLNNDAEETAVPGNQSARMGVGKVIQMLNGLPDAFRQPVADHRGVVDGSGNRGDRYFRERGNGAYIWCLGSFSGCFGGFFESFCLSK